jgi:hypothetical protein
VEALQLIRLRQSFTLMVMICIATSLDGTRPTHIFFSTGDNHQQQMASTGFMI